MDTGIGATLREARNRRKISLSEVEAATKIRVRYVRAMENEEWDVLPGEAYVRSFIRTYASHLGLDGERLTEEYMRVSPTGGEREAPGVEPPVASRPRASDYSLIRSRAVAVAVVAALIGVVVVIGLASEGDPGVTVDGARTGASAGEHPPGTPGQAQRPELSLELTATAEVWVCLLDADGRPLVNGEILAAGAEEGPFLSDGFRVAFGNGEVSMTIDGEEAEIPETSSPVGYAIGDGGTLEPLAEGERPDCL